MLWYRMITDRAQIGVGSNVEAESYNAPSRYGVVVEECPSAAYVVVQFANGVRRTWPVARLSRAETPAETVERLVQQEESRARWADWENE